ncbi:MAG: endopeptidase La [Nitrospinota bacterium]
MPEGVEGVSLPAELPILPLRGTVLFPRVVMPLVVARPRSVRLVNEAVLGSKVIGLLAQRQAEQEDPSWEDLFGVGTAATILKMFKMPDGSLRLVVQGDSRFHLLEPTQSDPYFRARVTPLAEQQQAGVQLSALTTTVQGLFQKVAELSPSVPQELAVLALNMEDPGALADLVASYLNISVEDKQQILETLNVQERLEQVAKLLNTELQVVELGQRIQSQMKEEMDKTQRDYFLREQLKAIQKELGEKDERAAEVEELRGKIAQAGMPEEVRKEAERELDRLARMSAAAAEYTVSRTYLDWLIELPWQRSTEDTLDIPEASRILDEDHYDLEKVKKRILEYLSVRKLKRDMRGPMLCFVGPPGVGKTSLGRSIARALGRKFHRISLGGVRDEAEVRGHRRTYVGALPGRIIQGIRKAGSRNPVFMLDEVDKLGLDFRGDPSAALLEVLDPEQNHSFVDHYLDVPFDLSTVMFITTANLIDPIPPALRDRMEVLELPGYTDEEKLAIAKRFVLPREVEKHGLAARELRITDGALRTIIRSYTREAGLRNLEREVAAICRAAARRFAEGRRKPIVVGQGDVGKYLGPVRFFSETAERLGRPGVAIGLAWTAAGGEIIFVEATRMPGSKNLTLTGQLGEVMKESAMAALSYLRSNARGLGVPDDFFEKNEIHVHVPAGAIPKDGPSAGTTMLTALASLITNQKARGQVAMTGEITLRGSVLPVGGIKEKVLAARRAGVREVILPEKNRKDLVEISPHMREGMTFHFVRQMDEVLRIALEEPAPRRDGPRAARGRKSS